MSDRLRIENDNFLLYGDQKLWADVLKPPYRVKDKDAYLPVSPTELETILYRGHAFIDAAILSFYEKQRAELEPKGFTVVPPSIWVAQLGSVSQTDGRDSMVYSAKGYDNGGVHYDVDEQRPEFEAHWEAVERAGFVPHVRGAHNGAYLMLRNDDER